MGNVFPSSSRTPVDFDVGPGLGVSYPDGRPRIDLVREVITTGGTGNAYTIRTAKGGTKLRSGLTLRVRLDRTNTALATLNVDGTGDFPWRDQGADTIGAGGLLLGSLRDVTWDDTLKFWISELPADPDAPMAPVTLKANLSATGGPPQDVPLATLAAPGNPVGNEIDSRLQRALVPELQLTSPFPTPCIHHIQVDPHRHNAGRIVDWGNGRWDYYYRSAYRHHIDYNAELRAVTTLDEGNTWSQERPVVTGTGSDLGGDVGAMLPDGRYAIVSPTLKPGGSETPTVYIVNSVNDDVEVVQLKLEDGSTVPGFGIVGFWSGEYRAGGTAAVPNVIQFLFYGAGRIYRTFYRNGVFETLKVILAAGSGPANTTLSEAIVGYAPDGRGYMMIRDSNAAVYQANEQRRPLLASFTTSLANGEEVWSNPVNTPITWSSVPPYMIPWRPRQHYLYTRSATANNVSQQFRGQMVVLNIDPVAFITSGGQSGFTQAGGVCDWQARLALPAWPHIQGGPTLMRDGTWALAISYGEANKLPSGTQGAPCRLGLVTNRTSPTVSEFGVLQMIGSGNGRPESYNGAMQVWTLGEAKRTHATPTQRLEACDGVSARRTGSAGGTYVMAADDGVQKVLRWGREPGDTSAAAMNLMGAIFGEDVFHLRGQWVTFCPVVKPGPNYSSPSMLWNVLCTNIVGQKITGSDGGFDGGTGPINSLITDDPAQPFSKTLLLPRQRYYADPFTFYVPLDAWMIAWRGTRVPSGTAGAGDHLDVARAEFIYGDRPTLHKVRPLADYRARTARIMQTTYARGVVPGTPGANAGALTGRRDSTTTGAEYLRYGYKVEMVAEPVTTLFSPRDGATGVVTAGTSNYGANIVNKSESALSITPVGLGPGDATYSVHVLNRCAAWDN